LYGFAVYSQVDRRARFGANSITSAEGIMALQAGLPLFNFSGIKGKRRDEYFAAVRASMSRDYAPMIEIFRSVLKVCR
jgi:hypothetical protein